MGACRPYDTSGKEGFKVSTRASQAPDLIQDGLPLLNYTTLFKEFCFLFGGTLLNSSGPPELIHDPILTYYGASPLQLFLARILESPCGPFDWVRARALYIGDVRPPYLYNIGSLSALW